MLYIHWAAMTSHRDACHDMLSHEEPRLTSCQTCKRDLLGKANNGFD